nr:unnamed protein product [Digitaria exilis]
MVGCKSEGMAPAIADGFHGTRIECLCFGKARHTFRDIAYVHLGINVRDSFKTKISPDLSLAPLPAMADGSHRRRCFAGRSHPRFDPARPAAPPRSSRAWDAARRPRLARAGVPCRRSLASRHDELKLDLLHESACGAPRKEEVPARADSRSFISFAATRRQTSLPRLLLIPFSSKAPGSASARRARGGWRTRGKATLRGQIGRQLRSYLVLAF